MKSRLLYLLIVFALASQSAQAAECNNREAYAAESVTDYLDSWGNVYLFFKQFGHCYDGSIAEGAGDKIQKLWADHWSALPEMIALTEKDAEFKKFIWQRISDETFPQDAFTRFAHHASQECPRVAKEFCRAVVAESARSMQPNKTLQPTGQERPAAELEH